MAKQRASVLLIVLGLAIVLFLLYRRYSKTKEGFLTTAPIVPPVMSSPGIITTFAGTGTKGYSGDNGPATSATLNWPRNILSDASGNIFIADSNNARIRMIEAGTGYIRTIAGGGTLGAATTTTGEGGLPTNISLNQPRGMGLDASGNLYIADSNNNKIRKVDAATNTITTIAGTGVASFTGDNGPATSATLNQPTGVALDLSGNVYIVDSNNFRIRKIDAVTKKISTIAGNGVNADIAIPTTGSSPTTISFFGTPLDIKVDINRNIYISTFSNILYIIAGSGTNPFATSIVSTYTQGFIYRFPNLSGSGLQGISIDKFGNVYWTPYASHQLYKLTISTGIMDLLAGVGGAAGNGSAIGNVTVPSINDGGSALLGILNYPTGCTVDPSGNVYIADSFSCRIRKVAYVQCVANSISCTSLTNFVCAPGFSNNGTACVTCPAGWTCSNTSNSSTNVGCPIGTSCEQWSSNATSCTNCLAGTYNSIVGGVCLTCPTNNASCSTSNFVCKPGFSNTGTACAPCPAGFACSGTVNTPCAVGTFSLTGQTTCTNCLAGTYTNLTGKSNCITCPPNSVCATGGTSATATGLTSLVCMPGFSNTGTACVSCPNGFGCSGTVNTPCAAGTYSQGGLVTCSNCGTGTYTPLTGQSNCITCPSNITSCTTTSYTCATGFSNTGSNCQGCPAGYSCSGTQNTPCAAGTYSLAGQTTCTPCGAGTYTNLTGQSNCITCPPNSACASGGSNQAATGLTALTCQPGFSNAGTTCLSCPNGFSCSGTTNTPCVTGTYSQGGLTTCSNCGAGTYTNLTGQSNCITCPANSVCAANGAQATATGLKSLVCSPSFSNTGTACQTCPPGYACSGTANSACVIGTYSAGGLEKCAQCGAGTYINATGQTACLSCPVNSTCAVGGTQATTLGLSALTCQPGFSNTGTACASCPPGYACSGTGNTACVIGTYSAGGQVQCSNCAAGTYNSTSGSSNCPSSCPVANTISCTSATSFTCAAGYYSNAGTCTICPTGSTCSPGGTSYLPGQTSFSAMSGWTCTGNTCTHNQYATSLPSYTQGSIPNMNLLLSGVNTSNCDKSNTCVYDWTVGSNVVPGPASANPCIALKSWYDFDKKACTSGTGAIVTTTNCTSNTVYDLQANACVQVRKPFASQPPNTINSPSTKNPGDFGNCKTITEGDCTPYYMSSNVFVTTNPCKAPSKYDFTTRSCTAVDPCCGLTPNALASNATCLSYVQTSQVYTQVASKCPPKSTDKCCSVANQKLAQCASYWTKSNVFTYSPNYTNKCKTSGFQDYNNGIDTIAEKRSKWMQSRQLINA